MQNYFTKVLEDNLKAIIKLQYVDKLPNAIKIKATVGELLESRAGRGDKDEIIKELDLKYVLDREPSQLSGGELQRFAIAMACIQKADV